MSTYLPAAAAAATSRSGSSSPSSTGHHHLPVVSRSHQRQRSSVSVAVNVRKRASQSYFPQVTDHHANYYSAERSPPDNALSTHVPFDPPDAVLSVPPSSQHHYSQHSSPAVSPTPSHSSLTLRTTNLSPPIRTHPLPGGPPSPSSVHSTGPPNPVMIKEEDTDDVPLSAGDGSFTTRSELDWDGEGDTESESPFGFESRRGSELEADGEEREPEAKSSTPVGPNTPRWDQAALLSPDAEVVSQADSGTPTMEKQDVIPSVNGTAEQHSTPTPPPPLPLKDVASPSSSTSSLPRSRSETEPTPPSSAATSPLQTLRELPRSGSLGRSGSLNGWVPRISGVLGTGNKAASESGSLRAGSHGGGGGGGGGLRPSLLSPGGAGSDSTSVLDRDDLFAAAAAVSSPTQRGFGGRGVLPLRGPHTPTMEGSRPSTPQGHMKRVSLGYIASSSSSPAYARRGASEGSTAVERAAGGAARDRAGSASGPGSQGAAASNDSSTSRLGLLSVGNPASSSPGSKTIPLKREDGETVMSAHKEILGAIAAKERRCFELREELHREESELKALQASWQSSVSRDLAEQSKEPAASSSAKAVRRVRLRGNSTSTDSSGVTPLSSPRSKDAKLPALPSDAAAAAAAAATTTTTEVPGDGKASSTVAEGATPAGAIDVPRVASDAWKGLSMKIPASIGSQISGFFDQLSVTPPERKEVERRLREGAAQRDKEFEEEGAGAGLGAEEMGTQEERESGALGVLVEGDEEEGSPVRVTNKDLPPTVSVSAPTPSKNVAPDDAATPHPHKAPRRPPSTTTPGGTSSAAAPAPAPTPTPTPSKRTSMFGIGSFSSLTKQLEDSLQPAGLQKRWKDAKEGASGLLARAERGLDELLIIAPPEEGKASAGATTAKEDPFELRRSTGAEKEQRDSVIWGRLGGGGGGAASNASPQVSLLEEDNEREKDALRSLGKGWLSPTTATTTAASAARQGQHLSEEAQGDGGMPKRLSIGTLLGLDDSGIVSNTPASKARSSGGGVAGSMPRASASNAAARRSTTTTTAAASADKARNSGGATNVNGNGGGIFDLLANALSGGPLSPPASATEKKREKRPDSLVSTSASATTAPRHARRESGVFGGGAEAAKGDGGAGHSRTRRAALMALEGDEGTKGTAAMGANKKGAKEADAEEDDWGW